MGPYASAKAGVEALSDALRLELAPSGVAVGCAYFGFLDTDLVRASRAQPSFEKMTGPLPSAFSNPAPLSKAIDVIERGVARRSARVWTPRWVGPMLALRGLVQPLIERQALRDLESLRENIKIAETSGDTERLHPVLGVAAAALPTPQGGTPHGAGQAGETEPGQAVPRG